MTLVERYVRAVRDFLPRGQKDDITNELSDSIQSRFEDEAAARGRPLTEDEQVAILRSLGHPMAVAARYRGDDRSVRFGGQLIGPELFPTYLTVLRINLAITLIIGAVSLVVGGSIWSAIAGVVVPFVIQFTIVTLIFIVGGPALAARPGRLGPANGELDGAGRRRVDPRRARSPADRQAAHA